LRFDKTSCCPSFTTAGSLTVSIVNVNVAESFTSSETSFNISSDLSFSNATASIHAKNQSDDLFLLSFFHQNVGKEQIAHVLRGETLVLHGR
jgi:hypothetical protein